MKRREGEAMTSTERTAERIAVATIEKRNQEIQRIANAAIKEGAYYLVPSADRSRTYRVTAISCTCPDFEHRGSLCRHREAVMLLCPPSKFVGDPFEGF